MQRLRGNDLVVQRGEPASHPGEEPGEDDHQEPHHLRVVADELGALGIVAHRVRDATQRRVRQGVHGDHARESPERDQVIDLDLRPVGDAEPSLADHAIAGEAALPAREGRKHERARRHHLAYAERDHREGRARPTRGHIAEQDAEHEAAQPADQRKERDGDWHHVLVHRDERVHGDHRAEPVVDGVAEGEQPGLAEQHVEGEREHRHDRDLREQGEPVAGARQERREQDERKVPAPHQEAPRGHERRRLHVSRAPMIPRGRKMRMATINMYGMIAASWVKERRASAGAEWSWIPTDRAKSISE